MLLLVLCLIKSCIVTKAKSDKSTSSIHDSGSESSSSSDDQKSNTLDECEPSSDESGVVKVVYLRVSEKVEEVIKNFRISVEMKKKK
eukprot:11653443-Ditylum_brightwellii.AAC.1